MNSLEALVKALEIAATEDSRNAQPYAEQVISSLKALEIIKKCFNKIEFVANDYGYWVIFRNQPIPCEDWEKVSIEIKTKEEFDLLKKELEK